ncbi:MAG: DnaJ domain-containing protein [Gomphosphaeria aponina SAG 52.96 = DSM 107014]|uniref:DnaJ domain-containing protein n=1 Tax=Gomphosphaeria aponina SAG 52.96 = DSM 107014 TaxID=1521640 RepID=A0A941GUE0_9CHRO|nr:DnaJ domain-containing protein [Gomphosphaeria aponina SAG 52.96 = DSM 107014]
MYAKIKQGLFNHDFIDHYAILGVPIDANAQQIRQRYLKIARQLHPDTYIPENQEENEKKKQASQILSKLVNPAYKELYNADSRRENQLLLSETARRLVAEKTEMPRESEAYQKLTKAGPRINDIYGKLVESLALKQYESLDITLKIIGQISEINKLYLFLKEQEGKEIEWKKPEPVKVAKVEQSGEDTRIQVTPEEEAESVTIESDVEVHMRRAREYLEKNIIRGAINELQQGKKLEPNNSSIHALIGLAYLREKQMAVAKIHLKKAKELNNQDPVVREVYEEYKKMRWGSNPEKTGSKSSANGKSSEKPSAKSDQTTVFGIKLPFFGKKK